MTTVSATRTAALATSVTGLLASSVGTLYAGPPGFVGGLAAAGAVLLFFSTSGVALAVLELAGGGAALGLPVVLMNYALRLLVVVMIAALLAKTSVADVRVFGATLMLCAFVWSSALAAATLWPADRVEVR